jgi:LPXTG-site transpeptidase (sortase) family protein
MRRFAWMLALIGSLLVVGVPAWVLAVRPPRDIGSLASVRRLPGFARPILEGPARPIIQPVVRSALLGHQAPLRERSGAIPVRLRIGAIGVDAPILPVGVAGGTTQIPADVREVGWYRFGSRPGERGSTLLVAHVSSAVQGAGVFFDLREMQPGDIVRVSLRDGGSAAYRVIARREVAKGALPALAFANGGTEVLTLVTCGGPYDAATGHYLDNILVYAMPLAGARG